MRGKPLSPKFAEFDQQLRQTHQAPDVGDVCMLKDWPGIEQGQRVYVAAVQTVIGAEYPERADVYVIELMPSSDYPRGRLGAKRTVPLDRLKLDPKKTRQMKGARS